MRRELLETVAAKWKQVDSLGRVLKLEHEPLLKMVVNAEPMFLTSKVQEIVTASSHDLTSWTPRLEDLIVPAGFMLVADPPIGKHIESFFWVLIGSKDTPTGVGILAQNGSTDERHGHTIFALEFGMPAITGDRAHIVTQDDEWDRDPYVHDGMLTLIRFFAACQMFMTQHILERNHHHLPRAEARRLQRAGQEPEEFSVVELRRQSPIENDQENRGESDHRGIDWQWQWMVRGHWRHCETGKTTWVRPHIKGPDGRPFKVPGTRVFDIKR
jgi:hypothetical protein